MNELKEKSGLYGLPNTLLKRNDIGVPDGLNNESQLLRRRRINPTKVIHA